MITQDDILYLVETADDDQRRIKEILLAVAGMIDDEGRLVDEPDEHHHWIHVMACHGHYGRGYRAMEQRKEVNRKRLEWARRWARRLKGELNVT